MKPQKTTVLILVLVFSLTFLFNSYAFSERQSTEYIPLDEGGINPIPYYNNNGILNCHFFVWGRTKEVTGQSLPAKIINWSQDKETGQAPRSNSIGLWGRPGAFTHSVFVESYENGIVHFTEGGYIPTSGFHESSMSLDNFKNRPGLSFYGFIYLANDESNQNTPTNSPEIKEEQGKKNLWTYVDPAKIGTTNSGYVYNTDLKWESSDQAVRGYYLTIERADRRGSYPIKCTITTSADETWTDIYGLSTGDYLVYINALGDNYQILDSHNVMLLHTDYSGGTYMEVYN